jgi:sulfur carrier protein ThiS
MAHEVKLSTACANIEANAMAVALNGGYIRLYDGSKPATGDEVVSGQTLLAEVTFDTPAFVLSVDGSVVANPLTGDPAANNNGQATWGRLFQADGTPMMDGLVGVTGSGSDIEVDNVNVAQGVAVEVTSCVITAGKGW